MAKKLSSVEVYPGENGGHRVVHNYEREPSKGTRGDIYMDRPKSEEHNFGAGAQQEQAVIAHLSAALGFKKGAKAEGGGE